MTNLDIIKYLATNNPTRLAELLDDIYCCAWNCGSYAGSSREGKILEECEMEFSESEWLEKEADTNFFFDCELREWSKAINNPSIEITYPDNLVIQIPYECKDPNHMWNTDNNYNIITPYMQAMFNGERYDDTVKIHFEGENNQ